MDAGLSDAFMEGNPLTNDLICFSHLRWDFVYQRPNHLMARAARDRRVFFVEEPVFGDVPRTGFGVVEREGVLVVTPSLSHEHQLDSVPELRRVVDDLVRVYDISKPVLWYYTPMALPWTSHLARGATVFDCMDHLAGFVGAPPALLSLERDLLAQADLVLTGGASLYAAKRDGHRNVHCFPSSVDVAHFGQARDELATPSDQASIPRPRLGYCGVIDERMDLAIIRDAAAARPDWQFVMIGPVVKIDPNSLPTAPNIHYLGMKRYDELPSYLAGWDAGIMPFAHNDATRFISPTKTPEYLAAGLPVVSTSIRDVVDPYGLSGLVEIGDGSDAFIAGCVRALATEHDAHRHASDNHLAQMSWDRTWSAIDGLIDDAMAATRRLPVMAPSLAAHARTTFRDAAPVADPRPSLEPSPVAIAVGAAE